MDRTSPARDSNGPASTVEQEGRSRGGTASGGKVRLGDNPSRQLGPLHRGLGVCVSPRALWLVGDFSCDCMFWDERGGGLTGQPVGPTGEHSNHKRTVLGTNHVDSGSFTSRCCAFQRTHTSADPIRLLCIRLVLPLTLSLPSGLAPSARLMVGGTPWAL